jgi:hypothetical protein
LVPLFVGCAIFGILGCSAAGSSSGDSGTSPGNHDTGTVTDSGTTLPSDTGITHPMDTGTPPATDTGTPPAVDTGTQPVMDTGTQPVMDTGTQPGMDSGGAMDTGSTMHPDAGTPHGDGGGASPDSGRPGGDMDGGYAGDGSYAALGCTGKTYKLCEDFDETTGTVGALPTGWTNFGGYAGDHTATDVALATDGFHSSPMSLKSDSMDRGQNRAQKALSGIGATAYNHWGRIFYKVQSPTPKPNTYLHVTFVSLNGPSGEDRIVDTVEATNSNTHQWLFNIPSDSCCTSTAYDWTFDANWHCAEWWVDVATESYRFFSDAVEVPSLAFTQATLKGNNPSMSDYTAIIVGATWYQGNGAIASPLVIWFDDLAIDDNRIGCQ